jgi:hypothetical protein
MESYQLERLQSWENVFNKRPKAYSWELVEPLHKIILAEPRRTYYVCRNITQVFTMIRIQDIAHLQTGVYAKPDRHGNAIYLQVKYFNEKGDLAEVIRPDIFVDKRLSRHLLEEGDVLFAAKGDRNFATVYTPEFGPCLASSSFFIIRRFKGILPEYLAWYINNPPSQKKLKAEAKGSSIPSISIKSLGELEIKIPDLKTQETILKIDKLRVKEKKILREIGALNDLLIEDKILSRIKP